jgi:superfamily II DNA or RNA helicase
MKSYSINIDRTGSLDLAINGIGLEDYKKIIAKMQDNRIEAKLSSHTPNFVVFNSTWENKTKIEQIMKEMSIEEHDTSMPSELPISTSKKDSDFIKIKSFSFGDLEIETTKFDYVFSEITKKIFNDRISFNGEKSYIISGVDKKYFKWYIKVLNESGYNTSPLNPVINLIPDSPSKENYPIITAEEVDNEEGPWNIKIGVNQIGGNYIHSQNELRKIVIFLFSKMAQNINNPTKEENSAEKRYSNRSIFYLKGTYKEFKNLQLVLEKNNFNTYAVGKLISDMTNSGIIKKEKIEGEIYGFKNELELNREILKYQKKFFEDSDIEDDKKRFFPAQIEGIKFLFTRSSALLGDEVGVGKTLQTIIAASLKMKFDNRACLLITKSSVIDQLTEEISRITGESIRNISKDWSNPKKWTVVPYHIFGDINTRKPATQSLSNYAKNNFFQVCILDEIHMIKNGDPTNKNKNGYLEHADNHTTFNVQEVTKYISTVWGASATIVANRPIDMLNQLVAINHPMGKMGYKEFADNFDSRESEEEQMKKADMIRDILIDQGSYIRRSKKEVNPNIPGLNVSQLKISLHDEMVEHIMKGISGNPNISQLSKIRERIAVSKVPYTVNEATNIINQGKKVAIFTVHTGTAMDMIAENIQSILDAIYSEEKMFVAKIHGRQTSEERSQTIKEFKSKSSKYAAIVIGIDAGGTGLDFPNIVNDVIVNDFDWSPSDDSQALGRFHRINSKEPVNVKYILAENTLDKKFFDLLQDKKEVAERIQTLSDREREEVALNRGDVQEQILKIRKKKYEEMMKLNKLI